MADADRLTLSLSTGGDVVIKLRPDLAPGHVERITELANERLLRRRRVPPRDPRLHGPGRRSDRHRHQRLQAAQPQGRIQPTNRMSAARARWRARPIPTAPTASSSSASTTRRFLDGQYTVWGEVESGMEYVDALPVGEPPREPGKIVKATASRRLT